MSQNQNIQSRENLDVAPTPQNTPLDTAVLANRPANLGRPQVEDIGEGEDEDEGEDVGGMNPASLLAQVCLLYIRMFCCSNWAWDCANELGLSSTPQLPLSGTC